MKEPGTGIGLDNTRKRLKHTYGNKYSLDTTETENFYAVLLTINNSSY
jgi:sensor histidine kinase YesM